MRPIRAAFALALLSFAGLATAQQQQFTSSNVLPIADDAYDGTLASMTCDTLPVTYGLPVTNARVRVNLEHTWIGDLTIKLVSPAGTVVTLLNRPGSTAPDTGTDVPVGDSTNWAAGTFITFAKNAGPGAETMGSTLGDSQFVCIDDGICAHEPAADTAAPGVPSRAFDGQIGTGNWRLCVGDSVAQDTGTLRGWQLTLDGSWERIATVAIPDDGYTGGFGGPGMACASQAVSGFTGTLADVALEIGMNHTWVGDLTIKLRGPDGTIATILNRPGSGAPDDGTGAVGNNANLAAATHIEYWQPATTEAEQLGAGLTTDQVVCVNNSICEYNPNRDTATEPDDLSTVFDGRPANGSWTLCIGDSAVGDTGALTRWRLTLLPATLPTADLAISKSDGATNAVPGSPVTYTIVATNPGAITVADARVTDTFPASLSACTWSCVPAGVGSSCPANGAGNIDALVSLAAGGTATFTATCNVAAGATGTLVNTATIAPPTGVTDPNGANNSSTDTDTLFLPVSDLAITKTDGTTTLVPGSPVTYTITASNLGAVPVTDATVADTFDPRLLICGWSCTASPGSSCPANGVGDISASVGLAPGGIATFIANCLVPADATGSLANTATIAPPAGFTDPNPANDAATDVDTLTPAGDIAITKSNGTGTAIPGTPTSYSIAVTNSGPSAASGATVQDLFPPTLTGCAWTCTASFGSTCTPSGSGDIVQSISLASGGSVTFTATCAIAPDATGNLDNVAIVQPPAGFTDFNPGNNSATDTDLLTPLLDVVVVKDDGVVAVVPGTSVTYTITASNSGPSTAIGTVTDVFDPVLANCAWTCVAGPGSSCPASGAGDISASVTIAPARSVVFTAACDVVPTASGGLANNAAALIANDTIIFNNIGIDIDTLTPQADLSITKSNGATTVSAGAPVTYTIVARNDGPSSALGAIVSDAFPAQLTGCTWTCAASPGSSCPGNGAGNIAQPVDLAPSGTATFTATCIVDPSAIGTLTNFATISSGVPDPAPGNETASDSDIILAQADLSVTKTDGATSAVPGTPVTWTIVAGNAGPGSAIGATLADAFPAVVANCAWTCAATPGSACPPGGTGDILATIDLLAGGSATFTATCDIASAATGSMANTATIAAPAGTTDGNPANDSATDTDTLVPTADLSITKSDGVASAVPGTSVTYTITAANAGPGVAFGATVADTFPADLTCNWTCTATIGSTCPASGAGNIAASVDLAVGGNATFTATCAIAPAATGTLTNTATIQIATGGVDPVPGNDSASDSDTLTPRTDLGVTKTDGVTTLVPGETVTYAIVATNAGPSRASGAQLVDTFPAGLTGCTWTCTASAGSSCPANGTGPIAASLDLLPTGSATFTATCTVAPSATGTLANTASVAAGAGAIDPNAANDSATDTDTLTPRADLAITKTDGVTSAVPGASVTYTIVASNAGPSAAPGTTVSDTWPASCGAPVAWTCVAAGGATCNANGSGNLADIVSLPPGGSATYTATCAIAATATGTLANTATVTAGTPVVDPDPANNSATDTDTLVPTADLAITKTDGATTAVPGEAVVYTIVATNAGPSTATDATVADTFEATLDACAWTCAASTGSSCPASGTGDIAATVSLASGGNATFTATCTILPTATGTLANTAVVAVAAGTTDPNAANDSATDTDTLAPTADLSITKTDGATSVVSGDTLTYTIVATNAGPSAVTGATVADTWPAACNAPVAWTCAGTGGGTCSPGGSGTLSDAANLPPGASVTYTASCVVAAATPSGTTISNTATVTAPAGVTDATPANDTATDTTEVANPANVTGTKTVSANGGVYAPGAAITYLIVLRNDGPGAQPDNPGPELSDPLPAGVVYTSASASSGTTTFSAGTLSWNGSIPAGGSVQIAIQATVAPGAFGLVTNQGLIQFDADGNGTNESSALTDDPGVAGGGQPTGFVVAIAVPALGWPGLALLAAFVLLIASRGRRRA